MTAREVRRILRERGGVEARQRGSHLRVRCGNGCCNSTVPVHRGEDIRFGTLRGIQADLAKCLGEGWLGV